MLSCLKLNLFWAYFCLQINANMCCLILVNIHESRGNYPPAVEYLSYAERSNINLVEAFKSMQVDEEDVPLENGDSGHEVGCAYRWYLCFVFSVFFYISSVLFWSFLVCSVGFFKSASSPHWILLLAALDCLIARIVCRWLKRMAWRKVKKKWLKLKLTSLQMEQSLLMGMRVRKSGVRIMKEPHQPTSNWLGKCKIQILYLVINCFSFPFFP